MTKRRWWPVGAPVMAGLLAIGVAGIVSMSGGRPAMAQQGDIQELARRALSLPGAGATVSLLPGALGTDMPLTLPTPSGANIVGTVVRDMGNSVKSWDVVLDVPSAPADAGGFYDQNMPGMGWRPPAPIGDQPVPQGIFCQAATGPWVWVSAAAVSDSASDVRVHVETGTSGPCSPPPTPPAQP